MSFISLLDRDLAVEFLPMMPVRLVELLHERDVVVVEFPTTSSSRRDRTCSRSGHGSLALGRNPETADAWNARGWTCVRSWATRSRGKATAGRPVCPDRSTAPDPRGQQPLRYAPARCTTTGSCCTSWRLSRSRRVTVYRCSRSTGSARWGSTANASRTWSPSPAPPPCPCTSLAVIVVAGTVLSVQGSGWATGGSGSRSSCSW